MEFKPETLEKERARTPSDVAYAVIKKYGEGIDFMDEIKISDIISNLQRIYGSLENLKDKKVLDLGCGSTISERAATLIKEISQQKLQGIGEHNNPLYRELQQILPFDILMDIDFKTGKYSRTFEPWFDRVLVELGAIPVGIDTGNLEGENFEHYNIDLSQKGSLDVFPDKSFDAVHSRLLFSSPALENIFSKGKIISMRDELLSQAKRLIKDDGKIISDNDNFGDNIWSRK